MKGIRIIIAIILLTIGLVTLPHLPVENRVYSLVMVIHFICVLLLLWKHSQLTPFFLFFATFTFLFIGGRFWVTLVDPDFDILTRGNFFYARGFTSIELIKTLRFILVFMYSAVIGYLFVDQAKEEDVSETHFYENKNALFSVFLNLMICVVAVIVLNNVIPKLMYAMKAGYMSLYLQAQNNPSQSGGGVGHALMWAFFGIAMVFGNHRQRLAMLSIMGVRMLILAYIGQRGGIGCFILFCIWSYYKDKQIRLLPLVFLGAMGLFIVWLGSYLSLRSNVAGLDQGNVIHRFFFSQGISLTVFLNSMRLHDYPILAYWADFLPGVGSIATKLSNHPIYPYDYNFTHYLAYTLNPGYYHQGMALGWTLMSDLYVFAKGKIFLYGVFSFLFGWICSGIEKGCRYSSICQIIVYTCFINFVFLPRAGLESIIPLIVWIMVIFGIVKIMFRLPLRINTYLNEHTLHQ